MSNVIKFPRRCTPPSPAVRDNIELMNRLLDEFHRVASGYDYLVIANAMVIALGGVCIEVTRDREGALSSAAACSGGLMGVVEKLTRDPAGPSAA